MASEVGPGERATLGGHEVLFQLKAGGMGEVLLARKRGPSGFERLVALKTMRSELRGRDALRRMFLDEAQLLARLGHPAIAQIFDFGEDRGVLYLAMEYVAGIRFRDLVALSPPPPVSARAMAEVCRALHAAHEQSDLSGRPLGVVHRDVSPDNLMLTWSGQVKVLDFGIALMHGRQAPVTEFGTIKGKPPYLAPEQLKSQTIDRRTDVFAAGAVLHELLTGAQLFDGDSIYAIVHAIEFAPVNPPSAIAGPLPSGLDDVVMRALERDPDRRWQSADELARALDQVAAAAGGENLADYAARRLGDEERRHRDWLRAVLERADGQPDRIGRPSGIVTAPAAFDAAAPTLDVAPDDGRSSDESRADRERPGPVRMAEVLELDAGHAIGRAGRARSTRRASTQPGPTGASLNARESGDRTGVRRGSRRPTRQRPTR
jgi:serine/threonine protein kinase